LIEQGLSGHNGHTVRERLRISKLVSKNRAISMSTSAGAMANGVFNGQVGVIPAFQRSLGDIMNVW
jgi:hypothetical protein